FLRCSGTKSERKNLAQTWWKLVVVVIGHAAPLAENGRLGIQPSTPPYWRAYFFSIEGQLTRTVIGISDVCGGTLTMKCWPSGMASYSWRDRAPRLPTPPRAIFTLNSGAGLPASTSAPVFMGTAMRVRSGER